MKMRNLLFIAGCVAFGINAHAQVRNTIDNSIKDRRIAADTSKKGPWQAGGLLAINFLQQNADNWIGVSERVSVNLGGNADLYANWQQGKSSWDNALRMAYATQKTTTLGRRKTADFFDFYSKYGRDINSTGTLAFATIFNLRSQFTDGYDYSVTPRRRVSGLFAPANILLTPGLEWKPNEFFSLFYSPLAARWVIVSNDPYSYSGAAGEKPLAELYGVNPARKVDAQFGSFASAKFDKDIVKNVRYASRLDLYSNYLNQPGNIDIYWTNSLAFKVNQWLNLSYMWNLAYDHDYVGQGETGPRPQFLGTFGIGIAGKF